MGDLSTWRVEILMRLPWLTRLAEPATCDQYRWSSMSVKTARDPVLREKYRCKRLAYWQFDGIPPRDEDIVGLEVGRSGTYCYAHLVSEAFIPYGEVHRYETWCHENRELLDRIKSNQEPRLLKRKVHRAHHDVSDEA